MDPQKPTPTRESERRHATVLFADISKFTALSEKMDPEEVTSVMNRCFAILEQAVTDHGGHVDKYIGDCIMAVFGVPNALERAPALAVHAAIEMRNRLDTLDREAHLAAPLELHIGINSGLVLAGHVGGALTRDFTVMGDTVNLASRLKDAAATGTIYVGAQTYRYTRDEFEYEALRPLTLKGMESPVSAYRVLSIKDHAHGPRRAPSDMIFSSLVGRDRELQQLEKSIANVRRGEGGIVSLVGEAGLGKSRLVAEMAALDAMRDATLLKGRSLSIGRSLPFHPFVDLFRQWAGITEQDADQGALAKLEGAVERVAPEDTGELVPFVATQMGLRLTGGHEARLAGIEGEAMEKLIVKSVRQLLQQIARARPLVVVFEDLHWADLSSIRLLESLLRLVQDTPILFLHVFRPDYSGPARPILRLARERYADRHVEIDLEPLSPKECDALVRNLLSLEDLPYATLGAILRKAEGNPFFIEEVIRSLIDEGAVETRDGRFKVTAKIASVVIPGTIQEVIMGRIDRLPESIRHVLQIASVIGRSFHHRVLADILPQEEQLDWALMYLKKRQLIVERKTGSELEYVFKHALAQETIYESILQKTRKELHLTVAHSIAAIFEERLPEFYGMLAYHFSRAESLERAEEYLLKAGDEAARSAASSEALSYFQEASRLYLLIHGDRGDPSKKALLEKNIGLALLNKGNLIESIPHFNEALAYLGEPVSRTPLAIALRFGLDMLAVLRHLYLPRRHRPARGRPTDREALQVRFNRAKAQTTTDTTRFFFDTIGSIRRLNEADPATIDQACGMYAGGAALFSFSGVSFRLSARFLDVARTLVREGNVRDLLAYRSMRFIHHYLEGDWSEEHAVDAALLEQGLRYGQLWDVIAYLGLSCERRLRQGDFAGTRAQIAKLAEIADVYGSDFAQSNQYPEQARLLLEERRLEPALAAVHEYYTSRLEKLFNLVAHGWNAKLWCLLGDRSCAAAALADAEKTMAGLAQVPLFHRSTYLLSRFLYDVTLLEDALVEGGRGDLGTLKRRARRSGRAAVKSAARLASERTETYRLAGRLWWLLGKQDQALRWWTRSIAAGERLGARPELARTWMEVGLRLAESGARQRALNGIDATVYLEKARSQFAALGLEWDLEQLAKSGYGAGEGVVTPASEGDARLRAERR